MRCLSHLKMTYDPSYFCRVVNLNVCQITVDNVLACLALITLPWPIGVCYIDLCSDEAHILDKTPAKNTQ